MSYRSFFFSLAIPFLLSLTVVLSGCTTKTSVSAITLPELTFAHYPVAYFDVNQVEIINSYEPGKMQGDISTQFPVAPDIAIRRYAENRLKPSEAAMTKANIRIFKLK